MKTAQEMYDWIEQNAADKGEGTTEDKAKWFVAYEEASTLHECNKIKDWAYMLQDGIEAVTVQGWLDEQHEMAEPGEDLDAQLVDMLRRHFGLVG